MLIWVFSKYTFDNVGYFGNTNWFSILTQRQNLQYFLVSVADISAFGYQHLGPRMALFFVFNAVVILLCIRYSLS